MQLGPQTSSIFTVAVYDGPSVFSCARTTPARAITTINVLIRSPLVVSERPRMRGESNYLSITESGICFPLRITLIPLP